jgi:hypothetical protein
MKQLSAHFGLVTSEGTQERKLEKLRRDLGEVFLGRWLILRPSGSS